MQRQDVNVPDPADAAAVTLWGRQMGDAVAAANGSRVRLHQIDAVLGTSVVVGFRTRLQAAAAALAAAKATAALTSAANTAAQAALADFTRTDYADAQEALAAATKAVGDELGRLMATATTTASTTATIDGLALRERYRTGTATDPPVWDTATIPFRAHATDPPFDPEIRLPAIGEPDHDRVLQVLADLDDTVDAVADVVAAESVHQLVAGNFVRASAALEIAASGTVTDDPDVIATPEPGHDVTHRVVALLDPDATPAWSADTSGLVATADPRYAAWLAGLLPDPRTVHVTAAAVAEDGSVAGRAQLTADALALDAPAWLRVTADVGELTARVALAARPLLSTQLGAPWTGRVVIDGTPDPTGPAGAVSLAALSSACAGLRRVMTTARALSAGDLRQPGDDPAAVPGPVAAAAVSAVHGVQDALAALDVALGNAATATPVALTATLLAACDAGLAEATPPAASGPLDTAQLVTLAAAARSRLATRLTVPRFVAHPADNDATLSAARGILSTLCGATVPLLVAVQVPADPLLQTDLADAGDPVADATPSAVRGWLTDHGRVRSGLGALLDAHDMADALGAATRLRPRATHRPREAGVRWAGADPTPTSGLVDIVALKHGPASTATRLGSTTCGLAVDSWVQTVPAPTRDTAVAFHYDEPRTDPPQAVLVAVTPDPGPGHLPGTWAVGDLVGVVTSTMALARQRAVSADLLDDARARIGTRS